MPMKSRVGLRWVPVLLAALAAGCAAEVVDQEAAQDDEAVAQEESALQLPCVGPINGSFTRTYPPASTFNHRCGAYRITGDFDVVPPVPVSLASAFRATFRSFTLNTPIRIQGTVRMRCAGFGPYPPYGQTISIDRTVPAGSSYSTGFVYCAAPQPVESATVSLTMTAL
jgi:hypothetical protein